MINKETKSSQDYKPLIKPVRDLLSHYVTELDAAIKAKDKQRVKVIISVMAVLNPVYYKKFLLSRQKKK